MSLFRLDDEEFRRRLRALNDSFDSRQKLYLRRARPCRNGGEYFGVWDSEFVAVVSTTSYAMIGLVRIYAPPRATMSAVSFGE